MKSHKALFLTALAILTITATANAAPLPNGTRLLITRGTGSMPNFPCPTGSCFSMEVAPGFVLWTDFGPGTDGGFIVGKAQKSGGQEFAPSSANITPGELTAAWFFAGNGGTLSTDPGGEQNIFSDTSCAGAGCIGKTELKYLYVAWNGNKIPLGSSVGCTHANCTADHLAGIFVAEYLLNPTLSNTWSLHFKQVISSGPFLGVPFGILWRGPVPGICSDCAPVAGDIDLVTNLWDSANWVPVVSTPDGKPLTCRIGTPPANGVATLANDCSTGTYRFNGGFVGFDSFTYIANDGTYDSNPGTVSVAMGGQHPTPTVTTTPSATPTPRPCEADYPVIQVSSVGKQGTLSVNFTGNIVSATNKEIKICPSTSLSYSASSTRDVVKCRVRNNLTSGHGTLWVMDHLKCTDKPGGKDKIQFKVKSGITK